MLSDAIQRELRARIKALDEEGDRLLAEGSQIGIDGYVEAMKKRTAKIIKRELLARRVQGNIPQGINDIKPINKGKELYE